MEHERWLYQVTGSTVRMREQILDGIGFTPVARFGESEMERFSRDPTVLPIEFLELGAGAAIGERPPKTPPPKPTLADLPGELIVEILASLDPPSHANLLEAQQSGRLRNFMLDDARIKISLLRFNELQTQWRSQLALQEHTSLWPALWPRITANAAVAGSAALWRFLAGPSPLGTVLAGAPLIAAIVAAPMLTYPVLRRRRILKNAAFGFIAKWKDDLRNLNSKQLDKLVDNTLTMDEGRISHALAALGDVMENVSASRRQAIGAAILAFQSDQCFAEAVHGLDSGLASLKDVLSDLAARLIQVADAGDRSLAAHGFGGVVPLIGDDLMMDIIASVLELQGEDLILAATGLVRGLSRMPPAARGILVAKALDAFDADPDNAGFVDFLCAMGGGVALLKSTTHDGRSGDTAQTVPQDGGAEFPEVTLQERILQKACEELDAEEMARFASALGSSPSASELVRAICARSNADFAINAGGLVTALKNIEPGTVCILMNRLMDHPAWDAEDRHERIAVSIGLAPGLANMPIEYRERFVEETLVALTDEADRQAFVTAIGPASRLLHPELQHRLNALQLPFAGNGS